ncbi:deoxyguanosinetriphosphate triphosphohydrolase [Leucobacter sp. OH2974_COT-288]|nr:deoxyguanosinetriphosphate triphosphohydrolase [Leucobacter sp. OH2974_COT-288]
MSIANYAAADFERFVPEQHSSGRSDFARDRARLIHSSAWRRLAAKTQVLSPTAGIDFARNRLTHSLEVAQIGRELAHAFGVSADLVDTACMAHDLGHPPFGHNGEVALNEWIDGSGGFEGNAQTLRLLTRLEAKHFDAAGQSVGLNLTRAALDASCKYPWPRQDADGGEVRKKFGYFDEDAPVFEWLRQGAVPGQKCFEAQLMDLSDDIAYSVHDFEDAIVSEFLDPQLLSWRSGHEVLLQEVAAWAGGKFTVAELGDAFDRLAQLPTWVAQWSGTRQDAAKLKNFTSDLIGRFAGAAITSTRESYTADSFARYGAQVVVPREIRAEIAVLKGIVAAYVMTIGKRKPTYRRQRELLQELLQQLWQEPEHLEPQFAADFAAAADDAARRRVIVDQVACLTDQAAISWYQQLCQVPLV